MELKVRVDPPALFSRLEREGFLELLKKQGQVANPNMDNINNCHRLCLCTLGGLLVGIGAIKNVYSTPFTKAGVAGLAAGYGHELGYLFIDDAQMDHRRLGLGRLMSRLLVESCRQYGIFATTELSEQNAMMHILVKMGFVQTGKSYKGRETGKSIGLFLLRPPFNWEQLKELFVKAHLRKPLKDHSIRLNALSSIEKLIGAFGPQYIDHPLSMLEPGRSGISDGLVKIKGAALNGAERSVLRGLFVLLVEQC